MPRSKSTPRSIPSWLPPALLSALLLTLGTFSRAPIVDALSSASVPGAELRYPLLYIALAPLSNLFDALTFLSPPQLFSTLAFVSLIAIAIRIRAAMTRTDRNLARFRRRDHFRFAASIAGGIIALCGLAVLMLRPMASLRVKDPDLLTIDFHSHTSASHDGRPGFTPEANRDWHRAAGFDVAYITDHHTFAGANSAARLNPRVVGEGTVLLPGLEYRDGDEHILALGLDPKTTDAEPREWHPLYAGNNDAAASVPALLILSLPGDVVRIPPGENEGIVRLAAVEISDGSPRGIEQTGAEISQVAAMAGRRDISVVAGSDNHGWGRAAIAWSVMRIPGWRAMTPLQLDAAIRATLIARRTGAVTVVSRRLPFAGTPFAIAMTGPELSWEIVRDIGWYERIAWVLWIWAGWGMILIAERRRSARAIHITWAMPEILPVADLHSTTG